MNVDPGVDHNNTRCEASKICDVHIVEGNIQTLAWTQLVLRSCEERGQCWHEGGTLLSPFALLHMAHCSVVILPDVSRCRSVRLNDERQDRQEGRRAWRELTEAIILSMRCVRKQQLSLSHVGWDAFTAGPGRQRVLERGRGKLHGGLQLFGNGSGHQPPNDGASDDAPDTTRFLRQRCQAANPNALENLIGDLGSRQLQTHPPEFV